MIFTFNNDGGSLKDYAVISITSTNNFDPTNLVNITFEDERYIIKPIKLKPSGVSEGIYYGEFKVQSVGTYTITCGDYNPIEVNVESIHGNIYDVTLDYTYTEMIPEMTSNTTPYGVVSGNVYSGSQPVYKAFTPNSDDKVLLGLNSTFEQYYVKYTFRKPTVIKTFKGLYTKASTINRCVIYITLYKYDGTTQTINITANDNVEVTRSFIDTGLSGAITDIKVTLNSGVADQTGYIQNIQVMGRELEV